MSLTRHAVIPGETLIGWRNSPCLHFRQIVVATVSSLFGLLNIADPYADACAAIQARTSLTFQHVTREEILIGLGNKPFATIRQRVGEEKGSGAGTSGRFGLCTS
jgi:hypothetical protein